MGTYHSMGKRRMQGPRKYPNYTETAEILDFIVANPRVSVSRAGVQHGMGRSTLSNWFRPPSPRHVNSKVVKWFNTDDNHQRWIASGRDAEFTQLLLDAINPPEDRPSVVDVGREPLVGPTGIGTFVPTAIDDLVVVKQEALNIRAEAESIALEATVLVAAIDTVHDWLNDKEKLQLALGRIESLQGQLKESETILERFRQEKLATNQIHSTD